ncbi:MAG: cob(I)yrinic acid a,c-diamide adenosyltransferase [Candidatus Kerfeldbacteria bacterium]|nr:cob(I)yrinic acid a,c-diamide adenosyltransferase [Candidatus Kerfeldbacteria bacterium]
MKKAPKKLRPADRGLVHAYIGDGKGKTTAAVGVAVRARGYGWRVLFLQFMKEEKWPSGERASLKKLGIEVKVMGQGWYKILNDKKTAKTHRLGARQALKFGQAALLSKKYNLVVMDELGSAVEENLLPRKPVEAMLKARWSRARNVHLIFTGHKKIPWMLKYCDLVTDMKMVKHPYYRGIIATKGIDY